MIQSAAPTRLGIRWIDGESEVWLQDDGPLIGVTRFSVLYPLFLTFLDAYQRMAGGQRRLPGLVAEPPESFAVSPASVETAGLTKSEGVGADIAPSPPPSPPLGERVPVLPSSSPPRAPNALPGVGETARNANWEVTLKRYGPYEEIVGQPPTGTMQMLVVAEFEIANLQRFTGTLTTNSVSIADDTGRSIAASGQTASVEKGFWLTWLQSGQHAEHRAVFELDPDAKPATLTIMGLRFGLSG
jgi:hypothetical protein